MILVGKSTESELMELLNKDGCGGIVTYFGYVREYNKGKKVSGIVCTKKEDTKEILEQIEREIREKFPVNDVILYHSLGDIKTGEFLAAVLVSAVHRKEGFEACMYGINRLKELEPVDREEY